MKLHSEAGLEAFLKKNNKKTSTKDNPATGTPQNKW
jgi:hypothetical protein